MKIARVLEMVILFCVLAAAWNAAIHIENNWQRLHHMERHL